VTLTFDLGCLTVQPYHL